jgi:hypothetical protein
VNSALQTGSRRWGEAEEKTAFVLTPVFAVDAPGVLQEQNPPSPLLENTQLLKSLQNHSNLSLPDSLVVRSRNPSGLQQTTLPLIFQTLKLFFKP